MGSDIMVRILEILDTILDEIRKDNPYGLVLKGGTALAFHHLEKHRESEDLDFDVDEKYSNQAEDIAKYITEILEKLVNEGIIKSYTIRKMGMASTNRFHMNITLTSYKQFHTKIDLDFVVFPENLEFEGELGFYTAERMFVAKLLTFESRKGLKDLYDISHLLRIIEPGTFGKKEKLGALVGRVVGIVESGNLEQSYGKMLGNIDLRFRNLKEKNVGTFLVKTERDLRKFRNELLKGI